MIRTGDQYTKPYGKEIFGVENTRRYPYPREELIKNEIFPYFIFDGGAYNLLKDHFKKTNGDYLLELTMSGKLFDLFQYKGEFNWNSSYLYTGDTELTKKQEWMMWPQRLYMTIPLAHKFLQTGDMKYANAWLKIIKHWDETHPYTPFDENVKYHDADVTWRDMQVTWRTLSILHGLFMLQDADFSIEDWKYIYDFIHLHIKHMAEEGMSRINENVIGNHYLQTGVALIFTGAMFPEFENVDEMINVGVRLVEMNLRRAIFADGGSNEDSPSYSHFIVRLYLEAYLLIEKNNFPKIEGLKESIKKQYEWLYQCSTPKGHCLATSDSYSMDALLDIEYMSKLIDLDFEREKTTRLFPDTPIAVFRKGDLTVFVDGQKFPGNHHHAGTPQLLMFYEKEPLIVDAGVCNYDRWEFYNAIGTLPMHNVVYNEDAIFGPKKINPQFVHFDGDKGEIIVKTTFENPNTSPYEWTRKVFVSEDKLVIEDEAVTDYDAPWKSRLLFKRNDVVFSRDEKHKMQVVTEDFHMTLVSEQEIKKELVPVMNEDNVLDYAVVVQSENKGKVFKNRIEITFVKR